MGGPFPKRTSAGQLVRYHLFFNSESLPSGSVGDPFQLKICSDDPANLLPGFQPGSIIELRRADDRRAILFHKHLSSLN